MSKWHLDPSSRLATTDMGRKVRVLCPFLGGAGPPSNTHNVTWAEAYLRTKWHLDPSSRLATTVMGRKLGDCAPFGGESWVPSNTMWPRPRPTSTSSFTLIHSTVLAQYTNLTDIQDNSLIAYGKPFYKRSPKNGTALHQQ